MLFLWTLLILFAPLVLGGTLCPPRSDIYPCTCANVIQRKNSVVTVVTCQHLADSDVLEDMMDGLRSIEIDQFYLYDSFWKAHALGDAGEKKKGLPADWITLLKIKEIDVVDTTLAQCFACNWNMNCRNSVTTRFAVTNSSSTDKVCTLCDSGRGNKSPWTGCMGKLKEFRFNFGRLTTLGVDLFPQPMRELVTLNMSHNQIVKVDPNTFRNLPQLISLDLSHNAIEFFDHMFVANMTRLQFLDLSWNFIKSISGDIFPNLPVLRVLKAENNMIKEFRRSDWASIPQSLKNIDISHNPIHCDCGVVWVNSTFSVGVGLSGTCATPGDYEGSPIRRASRYLSTRCDSSGRLGTRKPTQRPISRSRGRQ